MSGLNDNFLLADDSMEPKELPAVTLDVFKSNPEDETVPELRDDVDLIAATEDYAIALRDLSLLEDSIREQGGMTRQLALEAHAIMPEFLHDDRPVEYFTKMPSKTLLSAALEDIGGEKKSLLKRMVEKIREFIAKLIKRIKDYFIVDPEKVKAEREFAKQYAKTGPGEDQLKTAAQKATQDSDSKSNTPKASGMKPEDMQAEADKNKADASKAAGQTVSNEKAREFFNGQKMALISAMLGKDRMAVVAAMMEPGFHKSFHAALDLAYDWTEKSMTNKIDVIEKRIRDLGEEVNNCNTVIAEFNNDGEESNRKVLSTWITGKDHAAIDRVNSYFDDSFDKCAVVPRAIADYLEELNQEVAKAGHTDPNQEQQHLQAIQKEVSALATLTTLIAKVDNCYSTVIKGLRK